MDSPAPAEPAKAPAFPEQALRTELAVLIVETLNLEIPPAAIDPDAPLFHEGLGLDSIDALELALAVSRQYGVAITSDAPGTRSAFASLGALARFIADQSAAAPPAPPEG